MAMDLEARGIDLGPDGPMRRWAGPAGVNETINAANAGAARNFDEIPAGFFDVEGAFQVPEPGLEDRFGAPAAEPASARPPLREVELPEPSADDSGVIKPSGPGRARSTPRLGGAAAFFGHAQDYDAARGVAYNDWARVASPWSGRAADLLAAATGRAHAVPKPPVRAAAGALGPSGTPPSGPSAGGASGGSDVSGGGAQWDPLVDITKDVFLYRAARSTDFGSAGRMDRKSARQGFDLLYRGVGKGSDVYGQSTAHGIGRRNGVRALTGGSRLAGPKPALLEAQADPRAKFDDRWMGRGPQDAVFTGVYVDPVTGLQFDWYESPPIAPNKDRGVSANAAHRQFRALHGGWTPTDARPHKRADTVADERVLVPSFPLEIEERARERMLELARLDDMRGPHNDEFAWTDDEGYAHVNLDHVPALRDGLNEALEARVYPKPDLGVHRGLHVTGVGRLQTAVGPERDPSLARSADRTDPRRSEDLVVALGELFAARAPDAARDASTARSAERTAPRRAEDLVASWLSHAFNAALPAAASELRAADRTDPRRAGTLVAELGRLAAEAVARDASAGSMMRRALQTAVRRVEERVVATGTYMVSDTPTAGSTMRQALLTEARRDDAAVRALGELLYATYTGPAAPAAVRETVLSDPRAPEVLIQELGRAAISSGAAGIADAAGLIRSADMTAVRRAHDLLNQIGAAGLFGITVGSGVLAPSAIRSAEHDDVRAKGGIDSSGHALTAARLIEASLGAASTIREAEDERADRAADRRIDEPLQPTPASIFRAPPLTTRLSPVVTRAALRARESVVPRA